MAPLWVLVRLIPYLALCCAFAYVLAFLPQSQEYLALIRETSSRGITFELGLKYIVNAIYYLLFCFLLGKSFQEIILTHAHLPLEGAKRYGLGFIFFALFSAPVVVVLSAVLSSPAVTLENLVSICISILVFFAIIKIILKILNIKESNSQYFNKHTFWLCMLLLIFLFSFNSFDVVRASRFFGTIGIITGTLAFLQGAILVLSHYKKHQYPILSIFITAVLAGHLITSITGPRYLRSGSSLSRPAPEASTGFQQWLTARHDQILNYAKLHPGKKYPIFIVAAQGGGYYAGIIPRCFSRALRIAVRVLPITPLLLAPCLAGASGPPSLRKLRARKTKAKRGRRTSSPALPAL